MSKQSPNIEENLMQFLQSEIQGDLVLAEKILSTLAHMKPEPYEFNGNAHSLLVHGERFEVSHLYDDDIHFSGETVLLQKLLKEWAHSIRAF